MEVRYMKIRAKVAAVGKKLKAMYNRGKKSVFLYYTRQVNGKTVPNYKRLTITASLIAAAGAGVYYLKKHKKHGVVLVKKK